jgi:protocatechuate 3,4-dioxygenase beta subunit
MIWGFFLVLDKGGFMKSLEVNGRKQVIASVMMILLVFMMAACWNGGSSVDGTTLTGMASKGPIDAGTISAYKVVNGAKDALLGRATTDSNGNFSVNIGSYAGPVILEVTGGSYKDEAMGITTALGTTMSSIAPDTGISTTVSVTPISDAVFQIAKAASGGLTSTNIETAVSTMKSQLGFDPIATVPADAASATSAAATDAARTYAAYLGAVSQLLKDNAGKTLAEAITDLVGAAQGTGLANNTAFQTAINNFVTNPNNKTGLTQATLQTMTTNLVGTANAGGTPGGGACVGSCTVSGTYAYSATTGALNLTATATTFPGEATGSKPQKTVIAITTTIMTIQEPDGLTTSWFRSSGTAENIAGSWTMGNYTMTFADNGTFSVSLSSDGVALTYGISGKVTLNGAALSGVTVSLTGASTTSTTTDANGNYAFAGALNGKYTLAPSLTGNTFSPESSAITVNGANLTGQDFSVVTYAISGKVTVNGAALSGVTVSLTGASTTSTTTDANGNYAFTGALNGRYTLTTSLTGYDFSPASSAITVNGANLTGQGYTATVNTVALSGTVSAPGGSLAFNQPVGLKKFFARLTRFFVADAMAENPGTNAAGPGLTVNLFEINNAGDPVGSVLATAITDALGNYILQAPKGFDPLDRARKYVVQAKKGDVTLRSFVTGTTNDVDPYSDTTVQLITGTTSSKSGASITNVTAADVAAVLQTVIGHSADVSTTATNVNTLVADLQSVIANSPDSSNIIESIASPYGVTGTVTDSNNNPLANIKIAVRTYVEWETQAIIQTDAAGRYSVHAPDGDYVLAAFNTTTSSPAASSWWTSTSESGGGTTSMWSAEKITVAGAMVTKDFKLAPGGRISGKVTAKANGRALNGIHIKLRDFTNTESLMNVRTGQDGAYTFNVAPGTYYISVMNGTLEQAYATEVFNSPGGGTNQVQAQKLVIAAGDVYTADMSLLDGNKIEGKVTDENGSPIAGINVRVFDSTDMFTEGHTTGKDGSYRFWLRPGIYTLRARGQTASNVDISTASTSKVVTFNAAVSEITAKLVDANGIPVSQAYAEVYDVPPLESLIAVSLIGREHSKGDGSVTVYSNPATPVGILFKINTGDPITSGIYRNQARLGSATLVTAPAALGTGTLPAGGVLNGIVTKGGVPAAGALIQVRFGGKSYNWGKNLFVNVRTMIDGSYTVSLPLNVKFDRICAVDAGLEPSTCGGSASTTSEALKWKAFDNQTLTQSPTTLNFAY